MPILNNLTVNEIGGSSTVYGLNDKAWAGDLITEGGGTRMRTDQAVGTLTGLGTATTLLLDGKFQDSTGLVGAVDLHSAIYGSLSYAFYGTRITSLDLRSWGHAETGELAGICGYDTALTSVNLSDLYLLGDGSSYPCGLQESFISCTSLREIRLPSLRLDSWYWDWYEDPETGEGDYDYTYGISDAFRSMINGCSNLVVHLPSSLGEDLRTLPGGDYTDSFLGVLCGDAATKASCSLVFDLPTTDPFYTAIGQRPYRRKPSLDTASSLAWVYAFNTTGSDVIYTSGTSDPEHGDGVYSDSSCTTQVDTVDWYEPIYEYAEPEPEEEGGEEEPEEEPEE